MDEGNAFREYKFEQPIPTPAVPETEQSLDLASLPFGWILLAIVVGWAVLTLLFLGISAVVGYFGI